MSYTKTGVRVSLLPTSQYCGLAAQLSEAHGAGRAAAMSSAFHAQQAKAPDAKEKLARLTPKELDTISGWQKPSDVTVNGHVLTCDAAEKEQPVGLDKDGNWQDSGDVLTCGTLDFAWVHEGTAYVGDMKKTRWASTGPDSLQLLTYGYAWAQKHKCKAFCVGLWIIEDAEWNWSPTVYDMTSFEVALDLWAAIRAAAENNDGQANFGEHCGNCYGRLHCPEYTAPAALADTILSPAAVGGAIDDPVKLGELLAYCERVKAMIEKVGDHAKEAARRGVKVVHPVSGKVLSFVQCKGRESLNQTKLFAAIPEATRFVERGNGYERMQWSKPKAGK